jgi:hypothetical protein
MDAQEGPQPAASVAVSGKGLASKRNKAAAEAAAAAHIRACEALLGAFLMDMLQTPAGGYHPIFEDIINIVYVIACYSCQKRQGASAGKLQVKAAKILPLDGLVRFKQKPEKPLARCSVVTSSLIASRGLII